MSIFDNATNIKIKFNKNTYLAMGIPSIGVDGKLQLDAKGVKNKELIKPLAMEIMGLSLRMIELAKSRGVSGDTELQSIGDFGLNILTMDIVKGDILIYLTIAKDPIKTFTFHGLEFDEDLNCLMKVGDISIIIGNLLKKIKELVNAGEIESVGKVGAVELCEKLNADMLISYMRDIKLSAVKAIGLTVSEPFSYGASTEDVKVNLNWNGFTDVMNKSLDKIVDEQNIENTGDGPVIFQILGTQQKKTVVESNNFASRLSYTLGFYLYKAMIQFSMLQETLWMLGGILKKYFKMIELGYGTKQVKTEWEKVCDGDINTLNSITAFKDFPLNGDESDLQVSVQSSYKEVGKIFEDMSLRGHISKIAYAEINETMEKDASGNLSFGSTNTLRQIKKILAVNYAMCGESSETKGEIDDKWKDLSNLTILSDVAKLKDYDSDVVMESLKNLDDNLMLCGEPEDAEKYIKFSIDTGIKDFNIKALDLIDNFKKGGNVTVGKVNTAVGGKNGAFLTTSKIIGKISETILSKWS